MVKRKGKRKGLMGKAKRGGEDDAEGQFGNSGPDKRVEWFLSNKIMIIWRFTFAHLYLCI